ncbi:MAG: fused MFS/spermidine synthase [Labilithrix sp.]|nr:fused MFS/spermidine synthase [Labilithrix sp.]
MILRTFAVTIFVSAALLFACQPVVARMILPLLGGAPAVWIVCSLCFQALVLLGYLYAHLVGSRLSLKAQVVAQLVLIAVAIALQPVRIDEALVVSLTSKSYSLGVLAVLLRSVGMPFFVLATTSPLVQRWFAELGETDPYHLYSASNAGSLLALLGYPFLLEPFLGLSKQSLALEVGYVGYAMLIALCAAVISRSRVAPKSARSEAPEEAPNEASAGDKWRERLVWIGLAFAPSSLLLGVTNYVTTDIASVPLLWVVPLALYLGSFIVAFAKKQYVSQETLSRALALGVAVVAMSLAAELTGPAWLIVVIHLFMLSAAAVVCHRALALRRPHVSRLTEFYLLLSVGGVLGGIWNGLVAAAVFGDLYEYPLAIALVCLGRAAMRPKSAPGTSESNAWMRDVGFGLALAAGAVVAVKIGDAVKAEANMAFLVIYGGATILAFAWSKREVRFAVAIGGILLSAIAFGPGGRDVVYKTRDFFGVLKVRKLENDRFRILVFGTTIHGAQKTDPADRRAPLINFFPTGPAGDLLGPVVRAGETPSEPLEPRRLGVIGLGIGGLTAYARPGDTWTYFELNPSIVTIAKDHFTFLSTMPENAKVEIEVGDARLRLREGPAARFDVLVMDAFSSDAIPVHLMTREAIAINLRAMKPGGLLIAHISNRHLRLSPVVAALARDAGLSAIMRSDARVSAAEREAFKTASDWVAMSTSEETLAKIAAKNPAWKKLEPPPGQKTWTDDFSDLLGAITF